MKQIKNLFVILFIITSSCSIGEENLEVNQENIFYQRVNELIQNPNSYASVTPQKINPFEITLKVGNFDPLEKGYRVQESEGQVVALPDEIKYAPENFQNFSLLLTKESKRLSFESFEKLSYSLELEIINSDLTDVKKDFLLMQLAVLKTYSSILHKKLNLTNGRIACDSQFECGVLDCAERKVNEKFESAETWFETGMVVYELGSGGMAYIWMICTYLVLTEG